MALYPRALSRLISAFLVLPGIGRRTAERFAFAMLEGSAEAPKELAEALSQIRESVERCERCGQFSETSPCALCNDRQRDDTQLCVVADSRNISSIEQTGIYRGRYFVLGGTLNPLEGVHLEQLKVPELVSRVKSGSTKEVILALNANVEGDATALYLAKQLKNYHVKVTRLARGLPTGSRLEYADEATLSSAFSGRRDVS